MGYSLGTDVGTTFVAAAVADGGLEVVPLADDAVLAPAVVAVGDDGRLLTGEAAVREGGRHPDRVARELRQALGTARAVQLGGRSYDVADLLRAVLSDLVGRVTDRRGARPDTAALTYPATWDAVRRELYEQVAVSAGFGQPVWTTEPEAAATYYASSHELRPGDVLAVYDLGGSTFDATVLRRTDAGFETIGTPEQLDGVGGSHFDGLILGRVNDLSFGALDDLEMRDPDAIVALDRLRQACAGAKETLSTEMEATISVSLPNQRSEVSLTRGELETLIQAPVESTIDTLDHVLRGAGVAPGALSALLLVGGSSRIPLVAHRLAEAFGRPTVVGTHPEHAVALGAALVAQERGGRMAAAAPVSTFPVPSAPTGNLAAALPPPRPASEPVTEPAPAHAADLPAAQVLGPPDVARQERIPEAAPRPAGLQPPPGAHDQPPDPAWGPEPARDPAADSPPGRSPSAEPAAGHGPVVVPTPPRRSQRVTVVPARGGRANPVPAPSGGEVTHQPPAADSTPTTAFGPTGPAQTEIGGPERHPTAAFTPSGTAPSAVGPWPSGAPTVSGVQSPADGTAPPPMARSAWPGPTGAAPSTPTPPPGGNPPGTIPPGWQAPGAYPPGRQPPGGFPPGMPPAGASPAFGGGQGVALPPRPRDPGGFASPIPPPPPTGRRSGWKLPLIIGLVVVLIAGAGVTGYLLLRPTHGVRATAGAGASAASHGSASASAPGASAAPSVAAAVPVPSLGAPVVVGKTPNFVVASPSGRQLYIASTALGVVTVVDTAVNKVTATIPISAGPPQFLAFSPDGRRVYVSVWNVARTIAAVSVLDTTSNAIVATIPVRTRPYLAAVSPDGRRIYVPNHDTGTVSVIDATTNRHVTDFPVPANPHSIAFSPDGKRIYIADHESNLVSVVDTANNKVIATVPVPTSPHNVAVHRTRPLAIVASYDAGSVTAIDTNTNKAIATIPVGLHPQHVAYSADGRFAYVTNDGASTISVINVDTLTVTATIPTGPSPTSMAVLPNGRTGYVSDLDGGTLTVLNLAG